MNDYGEPSTAENAARYGVGSVRRARERMEAGLPPDLPTGKAGIAKRSNAPSPPNQNRRQLPQDGASIGENAIGVAISRPIPAPQWPLMDSNAVPVQQFVSDPSYRPPPGRTVAPQRPPRPSRGISILDSSQPQENVPSAFAYNAQSQKKSPPSPQDAQDAEESLFSPNSNNPRSPETPSAGSGSGGSGESSRPSTMSSVGTIPDFPLPILGPRRSGNMGPPPSARRGASSYYSSHASYVSPIPEESPRTNRSHSSYASSAAIPSSWGSASPNFYYEGGEQSPQDERGVMSEHGIIEEGRESRESNYSDNEEQGLVRQASVGKRGKPSLINTKSAENLEEPVTRTEPPPQPKENPPVTGFWGLRQSVAPEAAIAAAVSAGFAQDGQPGSRETVWPISNDLIVGTSTTPNIPPDSATYNPGTYNPYTPTISTAWNETETAQAEADPTVGRALSSSERLSYRQSLQHPTPPIPERSDARFSSQILGAQQAASSVNPSKERKFSRLSAIRRPPRLDMDAVRLAEARGSITSLPDLIRRATRLASMMDKGRRPASRFDWTTSPGGKSIIGLEKYQDERVERAEAPYEMRRTSGLGDMLAAFPAPGLATPTRGVATPTREVEARQTRQSPNYVDEKQNEQSSFDEGKPSINKKQRRCCGLPICGFVLIMIVVLLAVVAGIVVPIELLIVHKNKAAASGQLTLASCIAQVTCLNGGKNDISSGVCSCICVNGFTGATCASDADTVACTTADLGGTSGASNVTVGDSLARLITQAETNFTIPLSSTIILSKLNTANLSCVSQNSLVTFNGVSNRTSVTSSGRAALLPVVQEVVFSTSISSGVDITLTIPGGGDGRTSSVAATGSVTVELGTTTIPNTASVTIGLGTATAAAAAAAAAINGNSVTVELGSTTAASATVVLGTTTKTIASTTTTTAVTTSTVTTPSVTSTTTSSATAAATATVAATGSFAASQIMIDFARVAVLYVLQQESLGNAATAQMDIQQFLSSSRSTSAAARNISIGNGNTIDLIDFVVNVGNGTVGALTSSAAKRMRIRREPHPRHI